VAATCSYANGGEEPEYDGAAPPVRHMHGEEDSNAVDLQPKMQKSLNSHATSVRRPPTEATSTVKQAGEGPRSTPNHCSSTSKKKKNPKQKYQKEGERILENQKWRREGGEPHLPPH
jgi:hypothetical protein